MLCLFSAPIKNIADVQAMFLIGGEERQSATTINRKVHTPSKETVMKPAIFEPGFQAFKMHLHPYKLGPYR